MHVIRSLTFEDLPLVWRLKEQAGWNQTQADLQRYARLSGNGWFVAESGGVPCGTVATFVFGNNPAEAVAWIAMMLVEESLRGRGIGKALMQRALSHLDERGIRTIRLDATPQGRPLYESLGFVAQFELQRYAGSLAHCSPLAPREVSGGCDRHRLETWFERYSAYLSRSERATVFGQSRLSLHGQQILDFDRAVTNTDRGGLLRGLWEASPEAWLVATENDQLLGYAASRPGANATMIGPCIANEIAGPLLLSDSLARLASQRVYIDIPNANRAAIDLGLAHGLTAQRTLTRMCRGVPVIEQIDHMWASCGPETG